MPIRPGADVQGVGVVTLHGECDAYDEPVLAALLRERLAGSQPTIVDFSHATFVDSIVLGSLLAALGEAEQADVRLVLYLPERTGNEIHRVFSISGLDRILPLRRSLREAAAAATSDGELAPVDGSEPSAA